MSPVETDSDMDKLRMARRLVHEVLETVPVGLKYDRYFLALDDAIDGIEIAMTFHDDLEEP